MIAQRFLPLGWVAGIAVAATTLYLVSLQVASERARLEEIDRKIARTHRDIRQLQTELGTRASLRQLERWNSEVLALSAPGSGQYLSGEAALTSLDRDQLGKAADSPLPVMMAVMLPQQRSNGVQDPGLIERLTGPAAEAQPMRKTDLMVQNAIAARPQIAMAPTSAAAKVPKTFGNSGLLDRTTLGDIGKAAAAESRKAEPAR